jgi:hypothetical protein
MPPLASYSGAPGNAPMWAMAMIALRRPPKKSKGIFSLRYKHKRTYLNDITLTDVAQALVASCVM